jgi:signal transduction histidine kinase
MGEAAGRVLVVGSGAEALATALRAEGLDALAAAGASALGPGCGAVVAPVRSEAGHALELLRVARERDPAAQLLVTAAAADLADAVACLRQGACDILLEPVVPTVLAAAIRAALARGRLDGDAARLATEPRADARLAATGALLGNLAHQLNNPLTSLLASVRYVADALADTVQLAPGQELEELRHAARDALDSVERIEGLARDMAALGRSDRDASTFDLSEPLHIALRVGGAEIALGTEVELDVRADPLVSGSLGALAICFVQLLLDRARAFTAAGRRGRVRVTLRREAGDAIAELSDDARVDRDLPAVGAAALPLCREIAAQHGGTLALGAGPGAPIALRIRAAERR